MIIHYLFFQITKKRSKRYKNQAWFLLTRLLASLVRYSYFCFGYPVAVWAVGLMVCLHIGGVVLMASKIAVGLSG